jgi:hypothetical protein
MAEVFGQESNCQGNDTMTVTRHRHIVTQPLCGIRKSCSFFTQLLYRLPLTTSRVEAPRLWRANCPTHGGQQ